MENIEKDNIYDTTEEALNDYFGKNVFYQNESFDVASGQTINHSFNTLPNYKKIIGIIVSIDNIALHGNNLNKFGLKVNSKVILPDNNPLSTVFSSEKIGGIITRISDLVYAEAANSFVEIKYQDNNSGHSYTVQLTLVLKGKIS